jgi:hypothetical protein
MTVGEGITKLNVNFLYAETYTYYKDLFVYIYSWKIRLLIALFKS